MLSSCLRVAWEAFFQARQDNNNTPDLGLVNIGSAFSTKLVGQLPQCYETLSSAFTDVGQMAGPCEFIIDTKTAG